MLPLYYCLFCLFGVHVDEKQKGGIKRETSKQKFMESKHVDLLKRNKQKQPEG